jgi:hypothetical protein
MQKSGMIIRNASLRDLAGILDVEQDWLEGQRAGEDKFVARLEKFPKGFFVAEIDEIIVGTSTSCIIHYDPMTPEVLASWDAVTNNGYINHPEDVENPNALYIVSIGIKRNYRGKGIFERFATAQVGLAVSLGLPYVVAGAIMPGYDSYCKRHGDVVAEEYAFMQSGYRLIDPLLEMWRKLGFSVPDKRHVVQDYFTDYKSRNYSAIVIFTNERYTC